MPLLFSLVAWQFGMGIAEDKPQKLDIKSWASKRVLMIGAHPDDIEVCAGGLVALLTAQGTKMYYAIVTNGDKGCANAMCLNWTSEQLAAERQKEAWNAAQVLRVPQQNVQMFHYRDAEVTSYPFVEIKTDLLGAIRKVLPHIVMSWYPYPKLEMRPAIWGDLGFHPDHQAVGRLVLETQFESQLGLLMPDVGPGPWPVEEFYVWEFLTPTHYVDISAALSNKIQSYLAHKTQYRTTKEVADQLTLLAQMVATTTQDTSVSYAEGFIAYF